MGQIPRYRYTTAIIITPTPRGEIWGNDAIFTSLERYNMLYYKKLLFSREIIVKLMMISVLVLFILL